MDSTRLGLNPGYSSLGLVLLSIQVCSCCSFPFVDQKVKLGLAGTLEHARQSDREGVADQILVCQLPALVNDLLGVNWWLLGMLVPDHDLNIRDRILLLHSQAELFARHGRRRHKFNLHSVVIKERWLCD